MKYILITGCILAGIASTAAAQPTQQSLKSDFISHISGFNDDCRQGLDYTADLRNAPADDHAKASIRRLNDNMNQQMTYIKTTLSTNQENYNKDTDGLKTLEAKIKTDDATHKVIDQDNYTKQQKMMWGEKADLDKYTSALATEQAEYNNVQTLLTEITNTCDPANRKSRDMKYRDQLDLVKADQGKILTSLNSFAATFDPTRHTDPYK